MTEFYSSFFFQWKSLPSGFYPKRAASPVARLDVYRRVKGSTQNYRKLKTQYFI